jgi:hypothetical protein
MPLHTVLFYPPRGRLPEPHRHHVQFPQPEHTTGQPNGEYGGPTRTANLSGLARVIRVGEGMDNGGIFFNYSIVFIL